MLGLAYSQLTTERAAEQLDTQSSTAATSVPEVPRFPLGRPEPPTPEWDSLDDRCRQAGLAAIRGCMQSFVDYGSIVGLVTLVDHGDSTVQVDAVGQYVPNTVFQIMSMTKPFTSVLVMKLIEEGRIPSVESTVASLPGLETFPYPQVTIRQLLTHTSGVWPRHELPSGRIDGIAPHLTNWLDRDTTTTSRDKTLEFVASHYADDDLYPLASTQPVYSNMAFMMLGWIIERMSGRSFEQYMAEQLTGPLGLEDTFLFPSNASPEQRARIADVDRRLPDPPDYNHYDKLRPEWGYPSPEGGLYSTARDLREFLRLFRHGGQIPGQPRILSEASVEALMRPDDAVSGIVHQSCETARSLGFFVVREPGCLELPGLKPGTVLHNGRFSTLFWYDPQDDEIGIVLYQVVSRPGPYPSVGEGDAFRQLLARARP